MRQPGAFRRIGRLSDPVCRVRDDRTTGGRGRPDQPGQAERRRWRLAQGARVMNSRPDDTLAQLTEAGVAVWLDDISRERLSPGTLEMLIEGQKLTGVR